MRRYLLLCAFLAISAAAFAAELKQPAVQAFNQYVQSAEQRMQKQAAEGKFLWPDTLDAQKRTIIYNRAHNGEVVTQEIPAPSAPDSLLHDWVAITFVPNVTLQQVAAFLNDYEAHDKYYQPDITRNKVLSHSGSERKISLRMTQKKLVTTTLDVNMDVHAGPIQNNRVFTREISTRIAEVENAGEKDEHQKTPGNDHGYLWRLNSYWWAEQKDGGVYVQSEAITLTTKPGFATGWIVTRFLNSASRDVLTNMLTNLRKGIPDYIRTTHAGSPVISLPLPAPQHQTAFAARVAVLPPEYVRRLRVPSSLLRPSPCRG